MSVSLIDPTLIDNFSDDMLIVALNTVILLGWDRQNRCGRFSLGELKTQYRNLAQTQTGETLELQETHNIGMMLRLIGWRVTLDENGIFLIKK
jgi:hypothetical protein